MRRTTYFLVLATFGAVLALSPDNWASDANRPSSCVTGRFSTPAPDRTGNALRCEVSDDELPYPSGGGSTPQSISSNEPTYFLWLDTLTNKLVLMIVLTPAPSVVVTVHTP